MTLYFLDLARVFRLICFLALAAISSFAAVAVEPPVWIDNNAAGERQVHLYFFWTSTCPHCQAARPFVEALPARHPWLVLHSHNLTVDPHAADPYVSMAASLGQDVSSVPAFLFCGQIEIGFDRQETTGRTLEESLQFCRDSGGKAAGEPAAGTRQAPGLDLPVLGPMAPDQFSLPVFTVVIAGLDAFNPCAFFFVLLFLLSLLIHAGSRARMLFIGSVFLFFSGLIYFVFMAAWLNV